MGNGYDKKAIETFPADIYALREYKTTPIGLASIATKTWNAEINAIELREGNWTVPAHCVFHNSTLSPYHAMVPDKNCSCGYWGVWNFEDLPNAITSPRRLISDTVVVVIQVKGKIVVGEKGVRANQVRIVGLLHPAAIVEELRKAYSKNLMLTASGFRQYIPITSILDAQIEVERQLLHNTRVRFIDESINLSKIPVITSLNRVRDTFPIASLRSFDTTQ